MGFTNELKKYSVYTNGENHRISGSLEKRKEGR